MRNIHDIQNLIIKIGSNILTGDSDLLDNKTINEERIQEIIDIVAKLRKSIPNITIVSSGAIAAGFKVLGFKARPTGVIDKQACASVGQAYLMRYYEKALVKHNMHASQILITKHDFSNRSRYLSARSTIKRVLELGAIPIINENDTLVANELKYVETFGDNDNLSALVAELIDADMLMILSDVAGLYTDDPSTNPNAEIIHEVTVIDDNILKLAGGTSSGIGTGGMRTKILAAQKALQSDCKVAILNGKDPKNIERFISGEKIGTYFSKTTPMYGKRRFWITYATIPQGKVTVDLGAQKAIQENHSSLLTMGIIKVEGDFNKGDVVEIIAETGELISCGQTRYGSNELSQIKQRKSSEIADILGNKGSPIAVHRNDMGFA